MSTFRAMAATTAASRGPSLRDCASRGPTSAARAQASIDAGTRLGHEDIELPR
ncbi:hypothetical protein HUW62_36455 [Myxococcus sp. AM011]|uniref:hypothetical protein n=1 Tax=Myxococcus sp. AM011 TaxID=2745200 RepID=UPI00159548F2|nr:hypothetical protein [Myxococcus sp. AM011]NVJ26725.1 hypothetical protein [Myxococcus sp. AM011]